MRIDRSVWFTRLIVRCPPPPVSRRAPRLPVPGTAPDLWPSAARRCRSGSAGGRTGSVLSPGRRGYGRVVAASSAEREMVIKVFAPSASCTVDFEATTKGVALCP